MTPAPAAERPAVLQRVADVGARGLPCRRAAEQNARQHDTSDREEQHRNVQRHVGFGRQRVGGMIATITRRIPPTGATPSSPPMRRAARGSPMSSCRTAGRGWRRSTARTASSRCRDVPRASIRFATFTHAISSTNADGAEQQPQRRSRLPRQENCSAAARRWRSIRCSTSDKSPPAIAPPICHVRVRLRQRHVRLSAGP